MKTLHSRRQQILGVPSYDVNNNDGPPYQRRIDLYHQVEDFTGSSDLSGNERRVMHPMVVAEFHNDLHFVDRNSFAEDVHDAS